MFARQSGGVGQEEALRRREPVDRRGALAHPRVGALGERHAAEVGDVLAQGQAAVDVDRRARPCRRRTARPARSASALKRSPSSSLPPVAQRAVGVEAPALVVEAVGDLVRDDHADAAEVDGVVGVGVEQRRLQDAGREDDLVEGRVVVGVDDVGRHLPLGEVDRAGQLRELVVELEAGRAEPVGDVGVAPEPSPDQSRHTSG